MRKLAPFLQRQLRDLRHGGWRVVWRKGLDLIELAVAVPLVLAARLLRPFIVIRFGGLFSGRFGHFAGNLEVYLCEREAGLHGRRVVDLFYYVQPVCNRQLKTMWDRTLPISRVAKWGARLNGWFPGGAPHVVPWPAHGAYDVLGLLASTAPHLSFTAEEEERGSAALQRLGVPEGVPFIGLHARDPAYRNLTLSSDHPGKHLRDCRDTEIETCLPAAEALARRGYAVLRMGAAVEQALQTTSPRIIDYATTARSHFLDVFLCARCRFFLGDEAGIAVAVSVFRKPVARVNLITLGAVTTYNPHDLLIFKKLWLRHEHRLLTVREIFRTGFAERVGNFRIDAYEQLGIEIIDNTPDEITAVAVEMDERLKGRWHSTEEDEELQRRFWTIYQDALNCWPGELVPLKDRVLRSRIGAEFLRQHQAWLLGETLPTAPVMVSMR